MCMCLCILGHHNYTTIEAIQQTVIKGVWDYNCAHKNGPNNDAQERESTNGLSINLSNLGPRNRLICLASPHALSLIWWAPPDRWMNQLEEHSLWLLQFNELSRCLSECCSRESWLVKLSRVYPLSSSQSSAPKIYIQCSTVSRTKPKRRRKWAYACIYIVDHT